MHVATTMIFAAAAAIAGFQVSPLTSYFSTSVCSPVCSLTHAFGLFAVPVPIVDDEDEEPIKILSGGQVVTLDFKAETTKGVTYSSYLPYLKQDMEDME